MGAFAELGKPKTTTPTVGGGAFATLGRPTISTGIKMPEIEKLLELARERGGTVAQAAEEIADPEKGFLSKLADTGKQALSKTIRVLNVPSNVIAGIFDPEKSVKEAVDEELLPSDVLFGDIQAETKLGKVGLFTGKLATDILTDPLTYLTFGAGGSVFGIRAVQKVGGKALTKEGESLLRKGIELGMKGGLSEDFVKESYSKMLEASPELAQKFIDQGGVKFFGKTILSGQRMRTAIESVPMFKQIDRATAPIRNAVGSLFSRDIDPTVGKLPEEFTALRQKYLDLGQIKQAEAIDKVVDIARANKLTWQEGELINSAIEAGTKLADDRLENAAKLIEKELGITRKAEKARGILKTEIESYVPHILVDEPVKNIPFKPGITRPTLKFAKKRTIEGTIENINADFGKEFFDPNIIKTAAQRFVASARSTTAFDFFRETAEKFGVAVKDAPGGYVESSLKELKGFAFHPAIAKQLEAFKGQIISDEATNQLLRAFDKVQNFWKASVTSIFPAFHGRNAISNVFLNYLDIGFHSIDPKKHILATELLAKNAKTEKLIETAYGVGEGTQKAKEELAELLTSEIMTDRFGHKWTFGEIRNVIKNNRVAFGKDFLGIMDIPETVARQLEQIEAIKPSLLRKTKEILSTPFRAGRAVGNIIEQQARLVNFISNLKKTGDPMLAAQRTKQFLFDYQNLSPFEKTFLRRLIPFYTFTRKNLEAQAKTLVTAPGRIGAEVKTLNLIGDWLSGGKELTEEEKKVLPDWIKQGIGFLAEKKGEEITIFGSLQTPFEQPFAQFQPNVLLGSLSPIIRIPFEQLSGYEFFRGKPLGEVNNAAGFKPLADSSLPGKNAILGFIGYTEVEWKSRDGKRSGTFYVSLNPRRMHLITNLPPFTRVFNTLRQVTNQDISGGYRTLQFLTGVRPFPFDLEREERKRERELQDKLEKLLDQAGVGYQFKKFIPTEE